MTLTQAQAELDGIAASLAETYPETNRDSAVRIVPVTNQVLRDVRQLLLSSFSVQSALYCSRRVSMWRICCSLKTQVPGGRWQMQLALGAPRSRIIGGLLTESVMLGVLGAAAGLAFAYVGVKSLIALGPQDFPLLGDAAIDTTVLAFASTVALSSRVSYLRFAPRMANVAH